MGFFMSTSLVAVGAGLVSCASTLAFSFSSRNIRLVPEIATTMAVATGILSLIAQRFCKNEGETLNRKDYILIGGASIAGALAGAAIVNLYAQWMSTVVLDWMATGLKVYSDSQPRVGLGVNFYIPIR